MTEIESRLSVNETNNILISDTNNDSKIIETQEKSTRLIENNINNSSNLILNEELPLQFRWSLWYSPPREIDNDNKKNGIKNELNKLLNLVQ